MRFDKSGNDVTNSPELWCDTDCEIVLTNFPHPSITTGMHTNGQATPWIRVCNGNSEWHMSSERHLHKTVEAWAMFGISWFYRTE